VPENPVLVIAYAAASELHGRGIFSIEEDSASMALDSAAGGCRI